MASLLTQLQWCNETLSGLEEYQQEVMRAANNIDSMMKHLNATLFIELLEPIMQVYPSFQESTKELFADIVQIEMPYIEKQQKVLFAIVNKIQAGR